MERKAFSVGGCKTRIKLIYQKKNLFTGKTVKQILFLIQWKHDRQVSCFVCYSQGKRGGDKMRYEWMDAYLLKKRGVTKDYQPVWNWIRYHVGGKMFAAICLDQEKRPYYINLKLEPVKGEIFRGQYKDVLPGYYSDKINWNSIRPDGEVPDDLMKDMLDESYRLVLEGFSRKRQREILGITCCGTECYTCSCYGSICGGCNELSGKVFHAPKGKACPIYRCAVYKKYRTSCAGCEDLPCEIWRTTKDPELDEAEFEADIRQRMENLKRAYEDGI